MDLQIKGKKAFDPGSSASIGLEFACKLATEGASVLCLAGIRCRDE